MSQSKPIDRDAIRAGRIYSFVYVGAVKLNKGGRAGVAPNPLYGADVTKRAVYCGQACTAEMYHKAMLAYDASYTPDAEYTPRFTPTDNPCVVLSTATGQEQVRVLNPRKTASVYYVSGVVATPEQLAIINQYKPARQPEPAGKPSIMLPYIGNVANVDNGEDKPAVQAWQLVQA